MDIDGSVSSNTAQQFRSCGFPLSITVTEIPLETGVYISPGSPLRVSTLSWHQPGASQLLAEEAWRSLK